MAGKVPSSQDRLHDRYEIPDCAGITATIDGVVYRVVSLGYGGMGVEGSFPMKLPEGERQISLDILGQTFDCPGEVRFQSGKQLGLQFTFKHLDQLERLKSVMPWLALGAKIAESQAREASFRCRTTSSGSLSLFVEFKVGAVTCQLRMTDGVLVTWHDLGPGGELVAIRKTETLDEGVARFGMLALLSLLARRRFDSTLEVAVQEALKVYQKAAPEMSSVA